MRRTVGRARIRGHSLRPALCASLCLALFLSVVLAALGLVQTAYAAAPVSGESAHDLVKDAIYNELQDRSPDSLWEYRVERRIGPSTICAEQIETSSGPIHRLLSRDKRPLTSVEQREENARLDQLLQSASDQARVKQKYDQDEHRLERMMALMPDAFLFDYEGPQTGNSVKLSFVPNPAFKPPTYEARILHQLTGTVTVNRRQKRLMHIEGQLMEQVDFGWGLLGHVEKGGTFEIERMPVSAGHWKTSLIDIHMEGRMVLFKTLAQNQFESRSGFKPVPADITLAQARAILDRVGQAAAAQAAKHPVTSR